MFDLTGKTALVTGGSYGLGVVFADAGADIAVTARSTELLEQVKADIEAKGRQASAHTGDVTVREDVQRVVEEVIAAHAETIDRQGIPGVHFPIPDRT